MDTLDLSPMTIAALSTAAVLVIGALAAGIVTIITALHTLGKDTEAIKGHVNSEKTASDGREAALKGENVLLREMLADRKATAALLAQASAMAGSVAPPASVPAPPIDAAHDRREGDPS